MSGTTPLDSYAEAIPFEELLTIARGHIHACNAHGRKAVQRCAREVVREKLCPCAGSEEQIVEALVEAFLATGKT
ncbi:MAG: hypothetical protein OQL28_11660 [Sedimenticola sp.]|nr:hypothetical protein [Sedimenticola sp.]